MKTLIVALLSFVCCALSQPAFPDSFNFTIEVPTQHDWNFQQVWLDAATNSCRFDMFTERFRSISIVKGGLQYLIFQDYDTQMSSSLCTVSKAQFECYYVPVMLNSSGSVVVNTTKCDVYSASDSAVYYWTTGAYPVPYLAINPQGIEYVFLDFNAGSQLASFFAVPGDCIPM